MPSFGWIEVHAVDHCNNSCSYCNNSSPYATPRVYTADDFIPHLERLAAYNISYYCISILGGEPFLHPNLTAFTLPFNTFNKSLMLTTNGFWLSPDAIQAYEPLFAAIDILCISLYPSIIKKFSSKEAMLGLIDTIRDAHPTLRIDVRDITTFSAFDFLSQPIPVDQFCEASDCIALLPDGRLGRCGVGAFAHCNPRATPQFLACKDVFYDLATFDPKTFWMWRKQWPMDACAYCTNFQSTPVGWEYEKRIPPRARKA
ncbi:MAG: radical SAM protein [Desulfovibrionaceae bacterium]